MNNIKMSAMFGLSMLCAALLFTAPVGVAGKELRGSVGIGIGKDGGGYLIVFPINNKWLDTGIDISDGDTLTIVAVASKKYPPCDGRTGCPPYRQPDSIIIDGSLEKGLTALVGRIGEKGKPFSIGKSHEAVVPESGRLFLGYNDCWGCWGENTGAFEVTITVTKR